MNIAGERRDHDAAGSLADELRIGAGSARVCRSRAASPARVSSSPSLASPLQSSTGGLPNSSTGCPPLAAPPLVPGSTDPASTSTSSVGRGRLDSCRGAGGVAELSRTNRRTFLLDRVQDLQTYVVWSHDPQLAPAGRAGTEGGRWWLDTVRNWVRRKGNPDLGAFLLRHVLTAADSFRQLVDASCGDGVGRNASGRPERSGGECLPFGACQPAGLALARR